MKKIYARDCSIKIVDNREAKNFLEGNHTQGYTPSKIKYGLYYKDKLLLLMSFGKPRFNKYYQWEIIRECTKKGYQIIGGTSKLWKYFLKNNSCHSCICYSYPHNGKFTSHYIDYCNFKNIKKTSTGKRTEWSGEYNDKKYNFSQQFVNMYGVDKLLGTTYGNNNGSNNDILKRIGFKKAVKDYQQPQIDIYFPYGIVYKITDLETNEFYIGQCTNKNIWNNNYMGSGTVWKKHLQKYPKHNYKREILCDSFNTPKELDLYEIKQIKEQGEYKPDNNGKKRITNKLCLNIKIAEQRNYNGSRTDKICPECNSKNGIHKKTCSLANKCPECGGVRSHKKGCSKYKEPAPCAECGALKGHKKGCSKYSRKVCPECGVASGHKTTCSKYKPHGLCPECGGILGSHKKFCSKYAESVNKCPECGGKLGHHKINCSLYKQPAKRTPCKECGGLGVHKKFCSHYKVDKPCSECGGKHGQHFSNCSHYKVCPECGSGTSHKSWCSHYKKPSACPECGGLNNNHRKGCSKYKGKTCPECGGKSNQHKKNCSKYHAPKRCSECGSPPGWHKKGCSKYTECLECGGKCGHHKKDCSKNFKNR